MIYYHSHKIVICPNYGSLVRLDCGQWAWMTLGPWWKNGLCESVVEAKHDFEIAIIDGWGHDYEKVV